MSTEFQREKLLLEYLSALDGGDFPAVEAILRAAQQDPVLERMLLEVHQELAAEEPSAAPVDAAALLHAVLEARAPAAAPPAGAVAGSPEAPPAGWRRGRHLSICNLQFAICNSRRTIAKCKLQSANCRLSAAAWLRGTGQPWLAGSAAAAALALLVFTGYAMDVEARAGRRQTLALGQTRFLWGSPASLRVVALRDVRSQRPLARAAVEIRGRTAKDARWFPLFTGRTNDQGTVDACFRLPAQLAGDCVLSIQTGEDGQRDHLERPITIQRRAKVLLTTDKPLYQPAQTIHMRVLAMDAGTRRPAAGQPLTFEIKDPKGTRVFRKELRTSPWGIAAADFVLADQVVQGAYRIAAALGEDETEKSVTVKPYVLPKFRVDLSAERTYYAPGDTLQGRISAAYFFGKPVGGGKVSVDLAAYDTEFRSFGRVRGHTDAAGAFTFDARLPKVFAGQPLERGDALVRLTIAVTDRAGHEERLVQQVPVAAQPIRVGVVPEGGEPAWGLENTFYIVTTYPDGRPACTRGSVETNAGQNRAFATDASGIAEVALPAGNGSLSLEVAAADDAGHHARAVRDFVRKAPFEEYGLRESALRDAGYRGAGPEDAVLLRTDRSIYRVGDTLRGETLTRGATGTLYLDIARDGQTVLTRSGEAEAGRWRFAVDLSDDLAGTLTVHAYYLRPDLGMVRDVRRVVVRPAQEVNVAIQPSQESFRPGEEGKVRFSLTDAQGRAVSGALGVSIADESVFALRDAELPLERDYFSLEQSLLEPRYQEKFGVPSWGLPAASPEDAEAQRRARVALACLPGPKNFRLAIPAEMQRFARNYNLPAGDTDYALWVESRAERLAQARAYRARYVNGLYRGFLILSLLIPVLCFLRAGAQSGCLAAVWGPVALILLVASIETPGGEAHPAGVFFGLVSLACGAAARYARVRWMDAAVLLAMGSILAAILFPVFCRARENARKSSAMSNLKQLAMAQEMQIQDAATPAGSGRPAPPRLRQFFPETLFWQPEVVTDDGGRAEVTIPFADSITTWRLSALASSADGRVGSGTRGLRVFQEFFIDPDLPQALTQGDWVSVPVAVHNYLPAAQSVRIALNDAAWFERSGPAMREIRLDARDVGVVHFPITARRIGRHALVVTAQGATAGDAVRREIDVLPDGREVEQSAGDRLTGRAAHTVAFPPDAIPGTERVLLKVHPGTLSQVVDGLDGLLQVPYGCFEQTSSITYPNILVLDYLKRTGKATPQVQMRAKHLISLGYQRILTFETPGGGFDWFGTPPAKTILTAYGLMELHDMAKVALVDPALLSRARGVLLSRQASDGSWPLDIEMHTWSGVENPLPVTAFVTWALAYADDSTGLSREAVDRGLAYLENGVSDRTDPYTLALAARAFAAARPDSSTARRLLAMLESAKSNDGRAAFWKAGAGTLTYGSGLVGAVETTALAAQAMLPSGRHSETASRALSYLARSRGGSGAWPTTQATILSLQALVAADEAPVRGNGAVHVRVDGRDVQTIRLSQANSDILHQVDLTPYLAGRRGGHVALSVEGGLRPCYQVVTRCWVPAGGAGKNGRMGERGSGGQGRPASGRVGEWVSERRRERESGRAGEQGSVEMRVRYERTWLRQNDTLMARVTLRSRAARALPMLIADVGLAPGFAPDAEGLAALVSAGRIERYEVTPRQLILYLRDLPAGKTLTLPVRLRARFPVRAQTPPSSVYEYYNPTNRVVVPGPAVSVGI